MKVSRLGTQGLADVEREWSRGDKVAIRRDNERKLPYFGGSVLDR